MTSPSPADDPILKVLMDARARIEAPERWTQGVSARSKSGRKVLIRSKAACRWCATSAIRLSAPDQYLSTKAIAELRRAIDAEYVYQFNDSHTHAEVLDAFDRVIAARRAELAGVS